MEKVVVVVEEENVVKVEEVVANKGKDIPESPFCDNNCKKSITSLINESRKKAHCLFTSKLTHVSKRDKLLLLHVLGSQLNKSKAFINLGQCAHLADKWNGI